MRTIKFRGKIKSDNPNVAKRWAYGGLFYVGERAFIVLDDVELREHWTKTTYVIDDFVEVDPKTVGLFTGLKDKNGKEIYEGDIVNFDFGWGAQPILIEWGGHWQYAGFGLSGKRGNKRFDDDSEFAWDALNPQYAKGCEVIGNIYENKELLEAKK